MSYEFALIVACMCCAFCTLLLLLSWFMNRSSYCAFWLILILVSASWSFWLAISSLLCVVFLTFVYCYKCRKSSLWLLNQLNILQYIPINFFFFFLQYAYPDIDASLSFWKVLMPFLLYFVLFSVTAINC